MSKKMGIGKLGKEKLGLNQEIKYNEEMTENWEKTENRKNVAIAKNYVIVFICACIDDFAHKKFSKTLSHQLEWQLELFSDQRYLTSLAE